MLGGYRRTVARLERQFRVDLRQQPFVQEIGQIGCPRKHLEAVLGLLESAGYNLPLLFQEELSLREVQELCEKSLGKQGLLTDKTWIDEVLHEFDLEE